MSFLNALFKAVSALVVVNSLAFAADLPYGQVISSCTVPGTFALTFDDGPSYLTPKLLDTLRENGMKATFFVNGQNGNVNTLNEGPVLRRMVQEGHQIASHTYSHKDLSQESAEGIRSEMTALDNVLIQTIGKAPTFMRPPYFSRNQQALDVLGQMQYHVIESDMDTKDYMYKDQGEAGMDQALGLVRSGLDSQGTIVLMHDIHAWTVNELFPRVIPIIRATGKRFVTVGECLGVPQDQWYRAKSVNGDPSPGENNEPRNPSLPAPGCTYTVVPGDYCWKIANEAGISVPQLEDLNPQLKARGNCLIYVGEELKVPCKQGLAQRPGSPQVNSMMLSIAEESPATKAIQVGPTNVASVTLTSVATLETKTFASTSALPSVANEVTGSNGSQSDKNTTGSGVNEEKAGINLAARSDNNGPVSSAGSIEAINKVNAEAVNTQPASASTLIPAKPSAAAPDVVGPHGGNGSCTNAECVVPVTGAATTGISVSVGLLFLGAFIAML